jgi:hypothetical protein
MDSISILLRNKIFRKEKIAKESISEPQKLLILLENIESDIISLQSNLL